MCIYLKQMLYTVTVAINVQHLNTETSQQIMMNSEILSVQ
jgi:hypothetical protein